MSSEFDQSELDNTLMGLNDLFKSLTRLADLGCDFLEALKEEYDLEADERAERRDRLNQLGRGS